MNRKLKLLLIISIATIIPTVAVADVMVSGTLTISQTMAVPPVHFEPGSNYNTAHELGLITWTPNSPSGSMGTIDLEGSTNQTVTLVNVLDLNTSAESISGATIYVNITSTDFPSGTLYLSSVPLDIEMVSTGTFTGISSGQFVDSLSLDSTGTIHFSVTPFTAQYISFELPAGSYQGASLTITVQYVATGGQ